MQDIHAHLYWESFDHDRDEVIKHARGEGVKEIIVVGTTLAESKKAIELSVKYDHMYASVGIHPNEFRSGVGEYLEELERLAKHEKVIAIGECGLDYSLSHGNITEQQKLAQKKAFLTHITLATKLHLPIIIHCRTTGPGHDDAYQDVLEILRSSTFNLPAILHCYMGDTEVTKEFLNISHAFFSFTGNITYPVKKEICGAKDDITETVKLIPLERIFVETDTPFLAPQKYRGKRNEPAYVLEVAQKIAALKGVAISDVEQKTDENFKRVFTV